jgi:hypothetical protein
MFRQYIKTYVNSCAVGINDIDGLDFNIKPANNANINLIETNDLFVTKISSNGENTSVKIQNTADIYMKALPYLAGPSIASLGNLFDNKINNIPDFYLASSTLDQTKIEFNQILNDCDLNLAVMNKLKQVNANVNYNDFILEIKKITTLNANQQIYKLYLSAIANNNDIKINGV